MRKKRRFPALAESVYDARHFAVAALPGLGDAAADALAVMVSELATNSIRHAASHFTVSIDDDEERVRVAVTDAGPGMPAMRFPTSTEPTGRGLKLLQAFSDDWGVEYRAKGKTVWFTIDRTSEPAVAD